MLKRPLEPHCNHSTQTDVCMLAQGQTQGSTLQQCTNKTLTIGPFGDTYEADEVSPEVEAGGLQDSSVYNLVGTQICDYNT
jgi:hypothetical protein